MDAKTVAIFWQSGAGGGSEGPITVPVVLDGVVYGSCGGSYFCAYGVPGIDGRNSRLDRRLRSERGTGPSSAGEAMLRFCR
jgi:hypothetical protein